MADSTVASVTDFMSKMKEKGKRRNSLTAFQPPKTMGQRRSSLACPPLRRGSGVSLEGSTENRRSSMPVINSDLKQFLNIGETESNDIDTNSFKLPPKSVRKSRRKSVIDAPIKKVSR